ncbi:MAG: Ig-like domain-containing protein [Gemmataceae bacterium]
MLRLPLALAALLGPSAAYAAEKPPSFLNEVVPLLTKTGCNQGSCHGKGAGQNGFRLSLRGYAPEQDHLSITREFEGRRLLPSKPEESLFLLKATGQAPHEGGRLFAVGSPEYAMLLNWVKAGSPGPDKNDPKVSKLELTPNAKVLQPGTDVQLVATATFADGTKKDVTWLTKFEANDAASVDVSPAGKAKALRHGASAIRAMYQVEVAVAAFDMPFDRPVDAKRYESKNNFIDEHVFAKLKELRIEPSDLCTDAEFIAGPCSTRAAKLPTADEVKAFPRGQRPEEARAGRFTAMPPSSRTFWTLQLSDLQNHARNAITILAA